MSFGYDENEDGFEQQEEEEDDGIFDLIRRVECRSFIYDSRDPKHKRRDAINDAWNGIANGLKIKGKKVNDATCRRKWKTLRDYYYKVEKSIKGKSGDEAADKKPWTYYNAMNRVLSSYKEENGNTQSNFPGDDSSGIENQSPPSPETSGNSIQTNETASINESTPTGTSSKRRFQKRKSDANEKLLHEKILKVLEEPEEVKDQFYHFGMTICNKLRNAEPQIADYAMIKITAMMYEIMYPVAPVPTCDTTANQPPSDESTHDNQL